MTHYPQFNNIVHWISWWRLEIFAVDGYLCTGLDISTRLCVAVWVNMECARYLCSGLDIDAVDLILRCGLDIFTVDSMALTGYLCGGSADAGVYFLTFPRSSLLSHPAISTVCQRFFNKSLPALGGMCSPRWGGLHTLGSSNQGRPCVLDRGASKTLRLASFIFTFCALHDQCLFPC